MSAGSGWQDYAPSGGDGWQDYAPTKPAPQPKGSKGWSNWASDLGGIATGIPSMVSGINPMALPGRIAEMSSDIAAGDIARRNEGRSLAYRIASPIAQNLTGANVRGMEESANEGDVGGVLGHAAAVPTAMTVGELGPRAPRLVQQMGPATSAVAKTLATDAFSSVPGIGRLVRRPSLMDYMNAARTKGSAPFTDPGAPLPATPSPEQLNPAVVSPSRTLPGMNSPEVIRPPAQPIPPRSGLMLPGETGSQAGRLVDAIRQPSNMPTAASHAASDAAFAKNFPNEKFNDPMAPNLQSLWQQSAGFEQPTVDIGAKVRSQMPSVPRGSQAPRLIDQLRQIAAQLPPDEPPPPSGPPLRIEGQEVPADIDLTSALRRSLQKAGRNRPIQ